MFGYCMGNFKSQPSGETDTNFAMYVIALQSPLTYLNSLDLKGEVNAEILDKQS